MVLRKWEQFMDELELRRIKQEGGKGTIWITDREFERVADYFEGGMLSPGGAAGLLGVSRAMIHQLERDGKIRAFRIIHDDKTWEHQPFYVKLLASKKQQYIYIPIDDLVDYAIEVGREDESDSMKYYVEQRRKNKK